MNKKILIIISILVFIMVVAFGSIYYVSTIKLEDNVKQSNAVISILEQQVKNFVIPSNIEMQLVESTVNETTNENLDKEEIIDTKEENTSQTSSNASSKKSVETTQKNNQSTNSSSNSAKSNNSSTKEVTVNLDKEYDIKNGGSSQYSDWVEMPQDWLD